MSTLRSSNLKKLTEQPFDVLVLGGGINGAVAAASLAGRGVRVARLVTVDGVNDPLTPSGIAILEVEVVCVNKRSEGGGIGRPRVEPSFIPSVVDRMIKVPDAASYASIRFLARLLNRRCGGSKRFSNQRGFPLRGNRLDTARKGGSRPPQGFGRCLAPMLVLPRLVNDAHLAPPLPGWNRPELGDIR